MTGPDLATWTTIVGTWVLVVGTLAFAYWQLRQAQRLHSATTILELRERFFSARLREARAQLARWLLNQESTEDPENWEVGIFFELLGSLTRAHVLDRRMVWSAFGTWVTAYYVFLTQPKNLLAEWRAENHDPLIFGEFEWLAKEMIAIDDRYVPTIKGISDPVREARFILENDAQLRPGSGGDLLPE